MSNKVDLKKMCDRCFRVLGDNEPMSGFKLIDDSGFRIFKGHKECVEEMSEMIEHIYGLKEDDNGE